MQVAALLERREYLSFALTYVSSKQWSDRVMKLERPLFPVCVFVKTSSSATESLLCSTLGVVHILGLGGSPSPVPVDVLRWRKKEDGRNGCTETYQETRNGNSRTEV